MIRFIKFHFSLTPDPDLYALIGFSVMRPQLRVPPPQSWSWRKDPGVRDGQNRATLTPSSSWPLSLIPKELNMRPHPEPKVAKLGGGSVRCHRLECNIVAFLLLRCRGIDLMEKKWPVQ